MSSILTNTSDFNNFVAWEKTTHDVIDFKKIYADMTGDILAGLMLSEIVYWHIPNKTGDSKMRVERDGALWIACARAEWWERTRMTKRQADRALEILLEKKIVIKKMFLFNKLRMTHIHLQQDVFLQLWNLMVIDPPLNPYLDMPSLSSNQSVTPSNETVTQEKDGGVGVTNPLLQVTKSDTPITETTQIKDIALQNSAAKTTSKRTPRKRDENAVPADRMNPMKDAIHKVFQYPDWQQMTKGEKGNTQKAARELCEAGYTPADVTVIYAYCKARFDNFTPGALTNHASAATKARAGSSMPSGLKLVKADESIYA